MTLEELQQQYIELKEKFDALEVTYNSQKDEHEKSEVRIRELQDANQKLFLKVTQPTNNKQEGSKDNSEYDSILLGDYAKNLDENEIEFLKQLEEGLN